MPEYRAPGVYVEETSFRSRSIEGVGTSTAAIVGPTLDGPVQGIPRVMTSFIEYERIYGPPDPLDHGGESVVNDTALAVRAFFENGGKQMFVSRVVSADGMTEATSASLQAEPSLFSIEAKDPGSDSNFTLEIIYAGANNTRGADKKFRVEIDNGQGTTRSVTNVSLDVAEGDDFIVNKLSEAEDNLVVFTLKDNSATREELLDAVIAACDPELKDATPPRYLMQLTGGVDSGTDEAEPGKIVMEPASFGIASRYPGSGSNYDLELLWKGDSATATAFDLEIRRGRSVIASVNDLSIDMTKQNTTGFIGNKLADDAGLPVVFTLKDDTASTDTVRTELLDACDADMKAPDAIPQRFVITLGGGNDGARPIANDYRGAEQVIGEPSGLVALEYVEDIFTVIAPSASRLDDDAHQAIVNQMLAHCHKMRYRLALVDGKKDHDLTQIQTFRGNFSDDRLVLYYPWVVTSAPEGGTVDLPPSGFMAGVYARNDVERGVHKAPANTVPFGALRFTRSINAFQQELLNPIGINCLRSFTTRGHRVWGARTLGGDPEWKYVNIRRYFLYLERSIELSTQWAVFEPNGTLLWDSVRESIEDFLYNEWINGRLLGGDPKQAYFVRCDRTTMTQNDIDNGRLVCLVGVAPLTPAEFVVFRIGQKTADA